MKRRDFVKCTTLGGLTMATGIRVTAQNVAANNVFPIHPIHIDPQPQFELSPWLNMQFMEPLGITGNETSYSKNRRFDRDTAVIGR